MKSWRTTLVGCVGAAIYALLPLLKNGTVDPQTLILAATIAVLSVLAKDFNITGGS